MNASLPTLQARSPGARISYAWPWKPDLGDGNYQNPIIYADYSDPDVVRVGDDYYLTASSFNCTPALPLLHSCDLVNWTIIGHAVKNLPHPRYSMVQPGCGVWAPSIRFHEDKFWIFFPMPDEGIYVVTARQPTGPWSEPHLVQEGRGLIDPCPLWDDDGQAYLAHAYAGSRAGMKHRLRVCPMAPDASRLLGPGEIVYHHPEKHPTIEGPKFLKKDGWYYILAPAGGVETGWQLALRSRAIYGPYEDRILLHQGQTAVNGPHQGALVDAVDGSWWFLHFQDAGVYGRIVHLQPVVWEQGWPLTGNRTAGAIGEPVLVHPKPAAPSRHSPCIPQTTDEFDDSPLGLQWQWNANHRDDWYSLAARPGWLRLFPQFAPDDTTEQIPNLLLQKFPARSFSIEAALELHAAQPLEEAGIVVTGESSATVGIVRTATGHQLVMRTAFGSVFTRALSSFQTELRVFVRDGGLCFFHYRDGREWIELPRSFAARKGIWIGARIGLYSLRRSDIGAAGHVDVDYFRFR
jgi:beta-xylosidase